MDQLNTQQIQVNKDGKFIGIKGWLLFFVIIITIVLPFQFLIYFINGFKLHVLSDFILASPLEFFVNSAIHFLSTVFGIYTGIILWKRKSYAIKIVKIYLYTMMGVGMILVFFVFIQQMIAYFNARKELMGSSVSFDDIVMDLIAMGIIVIWFLIWILYFKYSRRVKETYFNIK